MTTPEKRLTEHYTKPRPESAGECLAGNLDAYEMMRERLEESDWGKWIVLCDDKLAGTYDTVGDATKGMVKHCDGGRHLIREVGAPERILLPSVFRVGVRDANCELRV